MCGIVGAIAQRDVVPILLEGLRRLEYRGYDSAGLAVLGDDGGCLQRVRTRGKVAALAEQLRKEPVSGRIGIAHTRWATHGEPADRNAHPHLCQGRVALVHNGIIENHEALREAQRAAGHRFTSDTDTEVVVHQIYDRLKETGDLLTAVQRATKDLEGAYALAVMAVDDPDRLVAARRGSPLVIGIGIGEHFLASDVTALLPVTNRFVFLEEGDVAELRRDGLRIFDAEGREVERPVKTSQISAEAAEKGGYRHYMEKEIYEQPRALSDTLEGRIVNGQVPDEVFGAEAGAIFDRVRAVRVIACGTSYHAGLVGRYWLEALAGVPCQVEVASEFRYREPVAEADTLVVTLSQSGETADTLAALAEARARGFGPSLAICNVPESSLVRASDLTFLTRAGPEIGVASTKAFTTQLVAMALLVVALGRRRGMDADRIGAWIAALEHLPGACARWLEALGGPVEAVAEALADKEHALFLGRGAHYPIAMEGALKLKEISYIHAEAYPAGELKHGPLALVDERMPVVAVAPQDSLLEKLKSNLQEVRARGGELICFAGPDTGFSGDEQTRVVHMPERAGLLAPVLYTLPLQLLAYHVAVIKGTDVDQPRNLAKSVTVE